jgi:hypothetical protein
MPNYSQWAITLPNQFAPAGQILEQGSVLQQRQNSQMMEMYRQRLKDQKDDMSANMLSLNKATGDIEKDKTGIEGIDATTHNRVNEVYQKYSKLAKQLSPDQYQAALANDLLEVSKWHQGAVMDYGNMLKERDEIMKQHPELDATKVFHTGMDNLAQRYVKQDGSYVPSDQINSTQSLFQNLQNPDELAAHTSSTEGIGKFFKGLDKNTINHVNETNKKGFIDKQGYKATSLGDLQEMEFDGEGNPASNPLKYEASDLKDSNGKPMRMITPELEKSMRGSGLGNQMDKLWMDSKLDVIKNWATQNRRLPSPGEEEDLKKSFLYSNFSQYVPSNISRNDLQAVPKPPHISVNINGAGAGNVNDVFKSINDQADKDNAAHGGYAATRINSLNTDAQNIVLEFARKTTGDPEVNYKNTFIQKDANGHIGIYRTTKDDNDDKVNKLIPDADHLIGFLPQVGTNLQAKQPGVAEKRAVVSEGNHNTPTHTSAKKKIAGF